MQGLSIPLHEAERGPGFPGPLFSFPDGPKTSPASLLSTHSNREMDTYRPAQVHQPAPQNGRRSEDMERGPIVSREVDQEWETWDEEDIPQKGLVCWKTIISKGVTRSEGLTLSVANLPPGGALREHRHTQEEVYLVLEGSGLVKAGGEATTVEAGSAVFIPGDALHSSRTRGPRTCGWPTSFRRTPSRRSSTSSRAEPAAAIISTRSRG